VIDIEVLPEVGNAIDRSRLIQAYQQAGGNISAAARLLGIHRATFYRHLQRLGLTRRNLAR
jgi:transcriptional regulator of acetoin/glycerol metabolism